VNIETLSSSKIGHWLNGVPASIVRFCNDSREIAPGDCFVAFVTNSGDGHNFLRNANANGATCALVSRPNREIDLPQFVCPDTQIALSEIAKLSRSKFTGTTIAVSGSFGKTTTKDILKLLLGVKNNATFENKNGQIGVPMTLAGLDNRENFAIVEIGVDAPGTMDGLADIVMPDIAIITGIGKIHLGEMGNEETIAHEKCKLLLNAIHRGGWGILAEECLKFEDFRKVQNRCFCIRKNSRACGYAIEEIGNQYRVAVTLGKKDFEFTMPPLMSRGIAKNFASACVCAIKCGIDAKTIGEKIAQWQPSKWRGEIIIKKNKTYFADCYNANPVALVDSLAQFDKLFPRGKRLFVIGVLRACEMGKEVLEENSAIFNNLPLRGGDEVCLIGENADRFCSSVKCNLVRAFSSAEDAVDSVENFSGIVYLKGHRYYKLESLIL
jgi:UDP-N-acetylmuramoyl-tripeptide--D-alanyl-D-alanine ligase